MSGERPARGRRRILGRCLSREPKHQDSNARGSQLGPLRPDMHSRALVDRTTLNDRGAIVINESADETMSTAAQAAAAAKPTLAATTAAARATAAAKAIFTQAVRDVDETYEFSLEFANPEVKATIDAAFDDAYVAAEATLTNAPIPPHPTRLTPTLKRTLAKATHSGFLGRASAARIAAKIASEALAVRTDAIFHDSYAYATYGAEVANETSLSHGGVTLDDVFVAASAADSAAKALTLAVEPFQAYAAAAEAILKVGTATDWDKAAIDTAAAADVAAKITPSNEDGRAGCQGTDDDPFRHTVAGVDAPVHEGQERAQFEEEPHCRVQRNPGRHRSLRQRIPPAN